MPARKRPLTKFELYALEAYAARHGRRWKRHLLADWMYARRRIEGELQALRNSHGPSWLVRFSFKHYDEQSPRK